MGRPSSWLKGKIKECMYDEWTNEWVRYPAANHSKSFYAKPDPNKARYVYKLARLELGRFARIITGHNNLRFFQTKIGLCETPTCRLCQEGQETITHFIRQCPVTAAHSTEFFLDQKPGPDMTWSVRKIIDFSYIPCVNEAFEGSGGDVA